MAGFTGWLLAEISRCVRCGACRPACPPFREMAEEASSPRGKVTIAEAIIQGSLSPSGEALRSLSLCLFCGACREACPNEVPVDLAVLKAKEKVLEAFPSPLSLGLLAAFLAREGFGRTVTTGRALAKIVASIAFPGKRIPLPAKACFKEGFSSLPHPAKGKAAFFVGCFMDAFFPETGLSLVRLLREAGIETVLPPQACCGIPHLSMGHAEKARILARKNVKSLAATGADFVVFACATCGSTIKNLYDHLIPEGDPGRWAYEWTRARLLDASQLLLRAGWVPKEERTGAVTFHDPCHLRRGMGVTEEPRELIRKAGFTLVEMKNPGACCGFGGLFSLIHPEPSSRSGRKRIGDAPDGAEAILTACPGCVLHLMEGKEKNRPALKVTHFLEAL